MYHHVNTFYIDVVLKTHYIKDMKNITTRRTAVLFVLLTTFIIPDPFCGNKQTFVFENVFCKLYGWLVNGPVKGGVFARTLGFLSIVRVFVFERAAVCFVVERGAVRRRDTTCGRGCHGRRIHRPTIVLACTTAVFRDENRRVERISLPLRRVLFVPLGPVIRILDTVRRRRFIAREEGQERSFLTCVRVDADGVKLGGHILTAKSSVLKLHHISYETLSIREGNLNFLLTLERREVEILEDASEMLRIHRVLEIHKAVSKIQPVEEISRDIEEIKNTVETMLRENLQQHTLGVFVGDVPYHDSGAVRFRDASVVFMYQYLLRLGRSRVTALGQCQGLHVVNIDGLVMSTHGRGGVRGMELVRVLAATTHLKSVTVPLLQRVCCGK